MLALTDGYHQTQQNAQCDFCVCERAVKTVINDEVIRLNFNPIGQGKSVMPCKRPPEEIQWRRGAPQRRGALDPRLKGHTLNARV